MLVLTNKPPLHLVDYLLVAQFKMQLILYNMVQTINHACRSKKNIAIVEIYYPIGGCNNNTYHLIIIIEPRIYIVEYVYLSDLNFYFDITDLYTRFGRDFVFPKSEEHSYHQFYSIYYLFLFHTFYHYIGCQLYLLVFTAIYDYINMTVKKQ